MIFAAVILGGVLLLLGLSRPAAGVGTLAAADMIIMEGLPLGGRTVAVESLFLLYMAAVPLVRWLVDGQSTLPQPRSLRPLALFALLFAIASTASTLAGGMPPEGARVLVRMPLWALFAAVPAALLRSTRDLQTTASIIVGASLVLLAGSLLQGLPETNEQGGIWRVGYKNPLGHGLALGCILAVCISIHSRHRILLRFIAVSLACGTVYTQSRGGMAAGFAGLAVTWWLASRGTAKRTAQLACLAAAPVLLLTVVTGLAGQAMDAVVHQEASSNLYRYQIIILSLRLFFAHPILGVGLGNLESATGSHSSGLGSLTTEIIAEDNDYARILAELGTMGVLVLGASIWAFTAQLRAAIRRDRMAAGSPDVARIMGASVGTFLIILGLFESVLFSPTGWFYVGFTWACIGARKCAFSR